MHRMNTNTHARTHAAERKTAKPQNIPKHLPALLWGENWTDLRQKSRQAGSILSTSGSLGGVRMQLLLEDSTLFPRKKSQGGQLMALGWPASFTTPYLALPITYPKETHATSRMKYFASAISTACKSKARRCPLFSVTGLCLRHTETTTTTGARIHGS